MSNKRCKICDRDSPEVFIKHKNFEILRCKHCGLYFQNALVDVVPLNILYNNIYTELPHTYLNMSYYSFRMKTQFDDISGYKKKPGNLLEIGCSYGNLLEYFIKKGWEATGIDISKNAIKNAKSKGLDCYNVSLEEFKPKSKFDVIILSNVLEHLQDPQGCLRLIKGWLKEQGIIYIRVPNAESIVLPSARQSFIGDLKPFEHFFYFNKSNLEMLLNQIGLKSCIKTDGAINLGNVLNCYFRSKIVLNQSWQDLNVKKCPKEKRFYLLAKHIYGEILTVLSFINLGPKNRELVAFAGLNEKVFVV